LSDPHRPVDLPDEQDYLAHPEDVPTVAAGRGVFKVVIRIAIGVAVVAVLILRTPQREELSDALRSASLGWFAVAAGSLFVGLIVSSFRWRAYLEALEIPLPIPTVIRLYFVGTFFNAFLPSGIGGDAYKAVRIGRTMAGYTRPFASVFLDRFAGFVALSLFGFGGVLAEIVVGDRELGVAAVSFVLSFGMLSAALAVLLLGERLLGRGRLVKEHGVGGKVRGAVRAIRAAARHPEAAARGYAFGLVFQSLVLVYHLAIFRALHLHGVSAGAMTGIVVVSSLATMVPLSPGGLGFREYAYVWALGSFGVARPQATAFALLILAILLITSAIGGIVYVIAGGEVKPRARRDATA